eukprot:6213844-Pleurochrysis_carterae.AAC.4
MRGTEQPCDRLTMCATPRRRRSRPRRPPPPAERASGQAQGCRGARAGLARARQSNAEEDTTQYENARMRDTTQGATQHTRTTKNENEACTSAAIPHLMTAVQGQL